jgi:hypothetical protein
LRAAMEIQDIHGVAQFGHCSFLSRSQSWSRRCWTRNTATPTACVASWPSRARASTLLQQVQCQAQMPQVFRVEDAARRI